MRKRIFSLLFALSCVVMVMAQKTSVYAYSQNTVECLGTELDGSQTVRVSGIGRTRADSREQCKKNEGKCIKELMAEGNYKAIVANMLEAKGLNYGQLPK